MGYRLEISKVEYVACGGKLFGYTNTSELLSYKWLKEKGFIDKDNVDDDWTYGYNPKILLNQHMFREFIDLYIKDFDEFYETQIKDDFKELAETNDYKLLEWY